MAALAAPVAPPLAAGVVAPVVNPFKDRIRVALNALGAADPLFAPLHAGRVSAPRAWWLRRVKLYFDNKVIGGGGVNECWIVPLKDTIQITRQVGDDTVVLRRTSWTRVMAYL